jgi:hypothetical protein
MEDISEKLGHVRVGRLKLAGLRTSGTCLFAPNNEGGKLKGDGPLISLAVKCGIAVRRRAGRPPIFAAGKCSEPQLADRHHAKHLERCMRSPNNIADVGRLQRRRAHCGSHPSRYCFCTAGGVQLPSITAAFGQ